MLLPVHSESRSERIGENADRDEGGLLSKQARECELGEKQ
jgi:hypothetical protein